MSVYHKVPPINVLLNALLGIQVSIEGAVHLKEATDIDFSKLLSFEGTKAAAADVDTVHHLEEVLTMWYKQIEQVCHLR